MEFEFLLAALAMLFIVYGVFSRPLRETILPAPLAFMLVGLALGSAGFGLIAISPGSEPFLLFAEFTLALVLFGDAARMDLRKVLHINLLARRMLVFGLPLTIALGAVVALGLFPGFGLLEAALLAAILAPTDAALASAVVENEELPSRLRRTIITESGLNDGLSVPVVLLLAALAGHVELGADGDWAFWLGFAAKQIGFGVVVGAGIGFGCGYAFHHANSAKLLDKRFEKLACIGVAGTAFILADLMGGNGFVSAFVCGLCFASICSDSRHAVSEFVENEGRFFGLVLFFIFGAALAPLAFEPFEWRFLAYAVLSLTVIRMVPVALSLVGTGTHWPTVLFLGWFGPRGLAGIVFVLLVFGDDMTGGPIVATAYLTIMLSIALHGMSAHPLSTRYAKSMAAQSDGK